MGMDREHGDEEDLCSGRGFSKAMTLLCRVRPHGSLWGAPVCSTWGWIGRAGTGRNAQKPEGDLFIPRIANANRMVVITTMLFLAAFVRAVHIFLEQPLATVMMEFSPMKEFLEWACPWTSSTNMQSFNGSSLKPLKLWSTSKKVQDMDRRKPKDKKNTLAVKTGKGVTGKGAELKRSQAYTAAFGKAVVDIMTELLAEEGDDVWMEDDQMPWIELGSVLRRVKKRARR